MAIGNGDFKQLEERQTERRMQNCDTSVLASSASPVIF